LKQSTPKVPETNNAAHARARQRSERALLVHVRLPGGPDENDVEELKLLTASAGASVCGTILGRRERPDAAIFVGKGKAQEIHDAVTREHADLVVVNHALTPAQERNLEKAVACRVLDRTGLILDIFAQRARSHEGKLQVELAQLEHLSTRLVRGWTHLERQKGGIGLRGPGETQLEVDRRQIRERIKKLNQRLEQLATQRRSRRRARDKVPIPTVSIVGYTNAGKSSLFNRITGASVYAADQLFATLDPTMRRVELPGKTPVVLADTVGFISHLPHDLVEAFKSTLEEVAEADLLLHVVDGNNPDKVEQQEEVNRVLSEIGAANVPQIVIHNKIDLTGQAPRLERDASGRVTKLWLSAQTGAGIDLLIDAMAEHYRVDRVRVGLALPGTAARLRATIHERFQVASEHPLESGGWELVVSLAPSQWAWLQQQPDFRDEYVIQQFPGIVAPIAHVS